MSDFVPEVEVEEFDDTAFNEKMSVDVEYPCIFISEITTEEELHFFKERKFKEGFALPLYCSVDGRVIRIGDLDLTLDTLLLIHQIADYSLVIKKSPESSTVVDLNDPCKLQQFIHL